MGIAPKYVIKRALIGVGYPLSIEWANGSDGILCPKAG